VKILQKVLGRGAAFLSHTVHIIASSLLKTSISPLFYDSTGFVLKLLDWMWILVAMQLRWLYCLQSLRDFPR